MQRIRILVVDDEPDLLWTADLILRMEDYLVTTTTDPQQALGFLTGAAGDALVPDILVTDLAMPIMSGIELIERARSLGIDIPTLVVSGHASLDGTPKILRAGRDAFLAKPFAANVFRDCVYVLAAAVRRSRRDNP